MNAQWTGDVVGKMHVYSLTNKDLARKMGYSDAYVCKLLNGKREPKDAEAKVRAALDDFIAERNEK